MRTTIPESLIQELAEAFPDRAPIPGTPPDRLWHEAGCAFVVRWLREQRQAQIEEQRGYGLEVS